MPLKFELLPLPYGLEELEPVISKEIMDLHYNKHYKTYLDNLNKALEQYEETEKNKDVGKMIALQSALKFNGGGYLNHSIFWTNLSPKNKDGGVAPTGPLADAINKDFGSLDQFMQKFSAKTVAIQGSGWGWLGFNKDAGKLEIGITSNQDPVTTLGLVPLLGVDVWEHAYYLQYKNVRADYVKKIWEIVNWKNIAERYQAATK